MHVQGLAYGLDEGDGESASKMLSELPESFQQGFVVLQSGMVEIESKIDQASPGGAENGFWNSARQRGIGQIDDQSNGDRFSMGEFEVGDLLEFVSGPVSEVQGACRGQLERISAMDDVLQMQLGGSVNDPLHRIEVPATDFDCKTLKFIEEVRILEQCHLDRFTEA